MLTIRSSVPMPRSVNAPSNTERRSTPVVARPPALSPEAALDEPPLPGLPVPAVPVPELPEPDDVGGVTANHCTVKVNGPYPTTVAVVADGSVVTVEIFGPVISQPLNTHPVCVGADGSVKGCPVV